MKSILKLFLGLSLVFVFSCDKEPIQSQPELIDDSELLNRSKDDLVGCETAFAYDSEALCFAQDDDLNSNRWGWSLGPLSDGFDGTFDIYQAAGKCDINNGQLVGTLSVSYSGGTVTVDYSADEDYAFFETHLYVGYEKYPRKKNGQFTVAPGQYGNKDSYAEGVSDVNYTVDGLSGDIYIIAHAVVCELKKEEECVADAGVIKADSSSYCLDDNDEVTISATPDGGLVVPVPFSVLYVLTQGPELVILAVSDVPSFLVTSSGDYTIHTLVYDPQTLDLSGVVFGTTTGVDVLNIIIATEVCASLDVTGAPIKVDKCDVN